MPTTEQYIGTIEMRSGDQLPLLAVALETDMGDPISLTTATAVTIILTNEDGQDPRIVPGDPPEPSLHLPGHIADGPSGTVTYDWDNVADLLRPGIVQVLVVAELPDGTIAVPSDRSARITVRPFVPANLGDTMTQPTVPLTRVINTEAPLTGGGDLSTDLFLAVSDFTGVSRGTVPASDGNTANFLRADGTWAAPTGAGVPSSRTITTTAPLTGGGDLTANLVLGIAANAFAPLRRTVKADTTTAYAPILTDENQMVTLSNAAAITVTLPSNATTAFPIGAEVDFLWLGVGQPTFAAGSGATVNGTPGLKLRAQYSAATAKKISTNGWVAIGDLAP